jgi:hypothetical protein
MQRIVIGLAAALSLLATALSPVPAQAALAGSYQQSCTNSRVSGDTLTARCNLLRGGTARSSISISSCRGRDIANSNGHLICNKNRYGNTNGYGYGNGNRYGNGNGTGNRYGNGNGRYGTAPAGSYQSSCTNVQMRGSMLSATCTPPNGNSITSTINASSCNGADIANVNGRLQCNGTAYGNGNGNGYGNRNGNGNGYGNRNGNGNGNGYGNGNGRYGTAPGGSYQSSCTNVQMNGSTLTATCTAPNGGNITSSINASTCQGADIANYNGRLRCQ